MTLLVPLALLSLLTLPIIVILHMTQLRRRRVEVPSLLLWRQIPLQATARRRRRLPPDVALIPALAGCFTDRCCPSSA
jgi:hypothetical protein